MSRRHPEGTPVYQHSCMRCGCRFESRLRRHAFCSKKCRERFRKNGSGSGPAHKPGYGEEREVTTVRKCLKCRKEFLSWGIGNRMCPTCRARPDVELEQDWR